MNERFRVEYHRDGRDRTWDAKLGVGELSEFIRNCDAYGREIVSVLPLPTLRGSDQ